MSSSAGRGVRRYWRRPHPRVPPSDDLVAAVVAEAAQQAGRWFPGLDSARVQARVLAADARPRCFLHRLELDDRRVLRRAVVKVRHSQPHLRRRDRFTERPLLNPERTMSDSDSARREYDALRLISRVLDPVPVERFGVLRPLAWLPEHSAIIMDLVEQPTLTAAVLSSSRLRLRRRGAAVDPGAWRNAGAWLRLFHDHDLDGRWAMPSRNASREAVLELYLGYCHFLVQRLGRSTLRVDLAVVGAGLVGAALPDELPLRTGHGDFVANNMFLGPAGRITVFDPLPRWRVPVYQDLATLVVGIRVHPVQAASRGLALSRDDLARQEDALLRGYFGADQVPLAAVKAYQLLVLLDRWTALVSKRIGAGLVRPHLHEARVRVAVLHYEREARRLLTQLADPAARDGG